MTAFSLCPHMAEREREREPETERPFVVFLSEILDHISSPFYYWIVVIFLFVCRNSLYIVDITLCNIPSPYKYSLYLFPVNFFCLLNFLDSFHCTKCFCRVGSVDHFLYNFWVSCFSCISPLWNKDINPFSKNGSCSLNIV